MTIKHVSKNDRAFWFSLDKHLSEKEFEKKVRDRQGYVLYIDEIPVGLLRYNLFWDNIPFCTMLKIEPSYQKQGYGKKIVGFWESDMKSQGYGMVMTSTQVDEKAQHFYRRLNYKDSGGLLMDISGYEQPMEMFFVKAIG